MDEIVGKIHSVIMRALPYPGAIEKPFGRMTVNIRKVFGQGAEKKAVRAAIYAQAKKELGGTATDFVVSMAEQFPRGHGTQSHIRIVHLGVIRWLQGGKNTAELDKLTTKTNRGDYDSGPYMPRFYHYPRTDDHADALDIVRESLGSSCEALSINKQGKPRGMRNLRLFSLQPIEALAEANKEHGRVSSEGVERYVCGMDSAASAELGSELRQVASGMLDDYMTYSVVTGQDSGSEKNAYGFVSIRGLVKPESNIVATMLIEMARAS